MLNRARCEDGFMSDMRVAARRLRRFAEAGGFDELCERHGVAVLVAFGSAVRDDETQARDLDIAVAFLDRDRTDVLALIDDLAAACSPAEIDLMDLGRASPVARERALVGGVPLYERERGDYARAQIAAIVERMDTEWLRRLELDTLAR